jgi:hypothetical protein
MPARKGRNINQPSLPPELSPELPPELPTTEPAIEEPAIEEPAIESKRKRAKWADEDIKTMLDILQEEKIRGNASENSFKPVVWQKVVKALNDLNKDQASYKSKYTALSRTYLEVSVFESLSGFSFDAETGSADAAPEVWNSLKKVKTPTKIFTKLTRNRQERVIYVAGKVKLFLSSRL